MDFKPNQKPFSQHFIWLNFVSMSLPFQGSDGELSWHCFSRDCLLFVWWAASHHPQFNRTHSDLWETALWIQQVRLPQAKSTPVWSTNYQLRADTTAFCLLRINEIDYMELRLWIGLHSCLQCFLLVVTDASYIIKYMTRFTEEGFSGLISFIFISDAIKKMVGNMLSDV